MRKDIIAKKRTKKKTIYEVAIKIRLQKKKNGGYKKR